MICTPKASKLWGALRLNEVFCVITVYHIVLSIAQIDDATSSLDGQFELVREELHKATIVIDEASGVPSQTTVFKEITGESIEFVNTYAPSPSEYGLGAKKTLIGRELKSGEFTFNLYLAQYDAENDKWVKGKLLEQAKNDENGNIIFKNRSSNESSVYNYFITEKVDNSIENVTFDTTEYMITVTCTDNLNGNIDISYKYEADGNTVDEINFKNTYEKPQPQPEDNNELPLTGDRTNLNLWFALFFISGASLFGTVYFEKRETTDKD